MGDTLQPTASVIAAEAERSPLGVTLGESGDAAIMNGLLAPVVAQVVLAERIGVVPGYLLTVVVARPRDLVVDPYEQLPLCASFT